MWSKIKYFIYMSQLFLYAAAEKTIISETTLEKIYSR